MTRGPNKQFDPEVVLAKAMEVFWARGYEAASLSELLKNMGINKKSLYDTFGNKRSLFLKALDYYGQTTIRSLKEELATTASPLENLKQVLFKWQRQHGQPGSYGCMLGTNIADFNTDDVEIAQLFRAYLRHLEDVFCQVLQQAQAVGELSPNANPRDLARMLLCTTQGMAIIGRILEDETLLASTVQSTLAYLEAS
ncbi:MAG: TetR/AcrR family transcriptional regulator [Okeania sp. SIO2D1]|nr:TetR/AcrR family transcriptional regulator [Okeania sp. SIO2D1]